MFRLRVCRARRYHCAVEHERLASAAAAAALAALTQGCSRACNAVTAEAEAGVLLAYPLVVGCASIAAVNQETEAVLQVQLRDPVAWRLSFALSLC